MADDREPPPWVSWKDYVDRRVDALSERMDERHRAQQDAVVRAAESNDRAFDKVNEMRGMLADQNARFVTLDAMKSVDLRTDLLATRVSELEQSKSLLEGRASQILQSSRTQLLYWGLALAGLQIALRFLWP